MHPQTPPPRGGALVGALLVVGIVALAWLLPPPFSYPLHTSTLHELTRTIRGVVFLYQARTLNSTLIMVYLVYRHPCPSPLPSPPPPAALQHHVCPPAGVIEVGVHPHAPLQAAGNGGAA